MSKDEKGPKKEQITLGQLYQRYGQLTMQLKVLKQQISEIEQALINNTEGLEAPTKNDDKNPKGKNKDVAQKGRYRKEK